MCRDWNLKDIPFMDPTSAQCQVRQAQETINQHLEKEVAVSTQKGKRKRRLTM